MFLLAKSTHFGFFLWGTEVTTAIFDFQLFDDTLFLGLNSASVIKESAFYNSWLWQRMDQLYYCPVFLHPLPPKTLNENHDMGHDWHSAFTVLG